MTTLIIEGADLAGKSTAINKIIKRYKSGFLLKNLYKPENKADVQIYAQYWKIISFVKANADIKLFVLDRFYPSQAVYSILRGEDELYKGEICVLDAYCSDADFLYVYLDTPLKDLKERYLERGDEHITIEQLELIRERYESFYEMTKLRKIRVNTTQENWMEQLDDLFGDLL